MVHCIIKGYMSAIGRTNYILCGYEFDNNEFISLLVRNFSLEWVSDCQTISRWEQVDSFIVLVHWNNSPRIDMSHHLDTLSWFRANQFMNWIYICLNPGLRRRTHQIQYLRFIPITSTIWSMTIVSINCKYKCWYAWVASLWSEWPYSNTDSVLWFLFYS